MTENTQAFVNSEVLHALNQVEFVDGQETLGQLKNSILAAIAAGPRSLVLDLIGIRSLSSEMITFLIWCQMECNRHHVSLRVRNVTEELLRVLRFVGMNQVIEIENTVVQ